MGMPAPSALRGLRLRRIGHKSAVGWRRVASAEEPPPVTLSAPATLRVRLRAPVVESRAELGLR